MPQNKEFEEVLKTLTGFKAEPSTQPNQGWNLILLVKIKSIQTIMTLTANAVFTDIMAISAIMGNTANIFITANQKTSSTKVVHFGMFFDIVA